MVTRLMRAIRHKIQPTYHSIIIWGEDEWSWFSSNQWTCPWRLHRFSVSLCLSPLCLCVWEREKLVFFLVRIGLVWKKNSIPNSIPRQGKLSCKTYCASTRQTQMKGRLSSAMALVLISGWRVAIGTCRWGPPRQFPQTKKWFNPPVMCHTMQPRAAGVRNVGADVDVLHSVGTNKRIIPTSYVFLKGSLVAFVGHKLPPSECQHTGVTLVPDGPVLISDDCRVAILAHLSSCSLWSHQKMSSLREDNEYVNSVLQYWLDHCETHITWALIMISACSLLSGTIAHCTKSNRGHWLEMIIIFVRCRLEILPGGRGG